MFNINNNLHESILAIDMSLQFIFASFVIPIAYHLIWCPDVCSNSVCDILCIVVYTDTVVK